MPQDSYRNANLAAGRPGQKLAQCDQVRVSRVLDPSAPFDELVPEITDMRDRSAERGDTKPQERGKYFSESAFRWRIYDSLPVVRVDKNFVSAQAAEALARTGDLMVVYCIGFRYQ